MMTFENYQSSYFTIFKNPFLNIKSPHWPVNGHFLVQIVLMILINFFRSSQDCVRIIIICDSLRKCKVNCLLFVFMHLLVIVLTTTLYNFVRILWHVFCNFVYIEFSCSWIYFRIIKHCVHKINMTFRGTQKCHLIH